MLKIELAQHSKLSLEEYLAKNKSVWEKKVNFDVLSEYYNVKGFLSGDNALDQLELEGLGQIDEKNILHLQCYFGLEVLTLARMGANATGLDFCSNAILKANELKEKTGLNVKFICADVYDASDVLTEKYDTIFSSYGSICWLPDLSKWAENIYNLLKPGGSFFIIDFHPLLISFNLLRNKSVRFSYFNNENPLTLKRSGTYADVKAKIKTTEYNWNHSLSEIISNFTNRGMQIQEFKEYPFIPLNAFPNLKRELDGYNHVENDLFPVLFSLKVSK
jgi:2-polyprenyl-3-methyl-5-hydroxy-6-metoxy-1,4-benzoquinol methylase